MKRIVYIFILLSFLTKAGNPPAIIFKENKGQWPGKVLFGTEILNTKFYITKNSFNYCVYNPEEYVRIFGRHNKDEKPITVHGHNYEVEFTGGDLSHPEKTKERPEYYNYFLGKDRAKWASNVKAYGDLVFNKVYEGIDLKLYYNNINLKYDFIIKPNANPNNIQLKFKYVDGIEIVNEELIVNTSIGNTTEKAPYAYQVINGKEIPVKCKYVLIKENLVGFSFPNAYNKNYELVIDPTVIVCSYSGASSYATGDVCTYDKNGNIYTGAEGDVGYPTTPGAFQLNGHHPSSNIYNFIDLIISAYNSNGSAKIFSTYIGGNDADYPLDMTVLNNEIIIFGGTNSADFPVTPTAYDTTLDSPVGTTYDIIISKLNMTGTNLLASTYIGGSGSEFQNPFSNSTWGWNIGEMTCDDAGNVYAINATNSLNFPTTPGALSNTIKGGMDAVVFKMNSSLTSLVWSTYLGGTGSESGISLKLDGKGGVYCFGSTNSTNFPTTPGAFSNTKIGTGVTVDLYVAHIDSTGSSLIASTYLGTAQHDYACLMDVGANNDVYLTGGVSNSSLLVPTPGCYNNSNGNNFIYKMNSSLSSILYKTKFGYFINPLTPFLTYCAFKVDSCGKIYISGFGQDCFPTTPNQFQPYGGGPTDLYMAVFNQNCTSLQFGSYFGGNKVNNWSSNSSYNPGECSGMAHFDDKGYLYSAIAIPGGITTTPNAYATTWTNTSTLTSCNDAFIKVDMQTFINANSSYGANIIGCPPFTPTFVSTTNTGTTYWNLGNGMTSTSNTVSTTYTALGNYNVVLVVTDTSTCNKYDSIKSSLAVVNPISFDLGEDIPACFNSKTLLQSNVSALTYSWSTGQTTPNIYVNQLGSYTLTINNGGCNSSDVINVVLGEKKLSERFPNVVTPNGDDVNDIIDFVKYDFEEIEFIIYDRWGKERFKTNNPIEIWNPSTLDNGTYYYVANYKSSCIGKHSTDKGFISVFK